MLDIGDAHICLSGGAKGADLAWGRVADQNGHKVVHFSFNGHGTNAPRDQVYRLTEEELGATDEMLIKASTYLKKHYPPKSQFVRNLLRRNYYQVINSNACYAVASIADGKVQGGTGWAVACFLDIHHFEPCDLFVFCQTSNQWFKWNGSFEPIVKPPQPTGVWAGIGSRDLTAAGDQAIKEVFAK